MSDAAINTEKLSTVLCPHCGAQFGGAHFCPRCGKIQPVAPGWDHFRFFDLPRKLRIDESELEKSFHALSRQFHPDYFMGASEGERQASMERSSMLNDAYRTLRDTVNRVSYLLKIEGYKEAEKKAPADLLEEVFELNMHIEQLKAAKKIGDEGEAAEVRSELDDALASLQEKLAGIDERLLGLSGEWDSALDCSATTTERKVLLDPMSELLSHRSYIRHLIHSIQEEL
ncbi:MAG TPA: Fe-S protein assembly co-chaperone HscB [Blastocatellia bacterium]|nr:Fe-S protein assembly co-chaperone HscB [Blastocatellia bacterium]